MRRVPATAAALAGALLLVGCGATGPAQSGERSGNSATASAAPINAIKAAQVAPAGDAAKPAYSVHDLAGTWVAREDGAPSEKDADDICATDYSVDFEADGTFDDGVQSGRWALNGSELSEIATVENADPDSGIAERKIDPPHVTRFQLIALNGRVLTLSQDGHRFWLFRCDVPSRLPGYQ